MRKARLRRRDMRANRAAPSAFNLGKRGHAEEGRRMAATVGARHRERRARPYLARLGRFSSRDAAELGRDRSSGAPRRPSADARASTLARRPGGEARSRRSHRCLKRPPPHRQRLADPPRSPAELVGAVTGDTRPSSSHKRNCGMPPWSADTHQETSITSPAVGCFGAHAPVPIQRRVVVVVRDGEAPQTPRMLPPVPPIMKSKCFAARPSDHGP